MVVYVRSGCFYCTSAVELLDDKGVRFERIVVDGNRELRRWLEKRTKRHTVPQVFINGHPVGGFDDLSALDRDGRLDQLLAEQPSVDNPALRS